MVAPVRLILSKPDDMNSASPVSLLTTKTSLFTSFCCKSAGGFVFSSLSQGKVRQAAKVQRARICRAVLLFGLLPAAVQTGAETAAIFPVKPVRLIIPYPAGGGNDI